MSVVAVTVRERVFLLHSLGVTTGSKCTTAVAPTSQAVTLTPKKLIPDGVCWLSQSSAARCGSLKSVAIQMMVEAWVPAA